MHYAGKKGFTPLSQKRSPKRTLNLWQLSAIADKLASEGKTASPSSKITVDLGQLGFHKLLGTGSISRAVRVKVDECSEGALKKLRGAGGDAELKTAAIPAGPAK